jgi:hypothetical protein
LRFVESLDDFVAALPDRVPHGWKRILAKDCREDQKVDRRKE